MSRPSANQRSAFKMILSRLLSHIFAFAAGTSLAIAVATTGSATEANVRFRVSVTLEVDGAHGSGAGVWEARFFEKFALLTDTGGIGAGVGGEAIPVTLSNGETVYVLRRSSKAPSEVGYGAFISSCVNTAAEGFARQIADIASFSGGCSVLDARPMVVAVEPSSPSQPFRIIQYADQAPLPAQVASSVPLDARRVEHIGLRAETTDEPISETIAAIETLVRQLPGVGSHTSFKDFHQQDFSTELQR